MTTRLFAVVLSLSLPCQALAASGPVRLRFAPAEGLAGPSAAASVFLQAADAHLSAAAGSLGLEGAAPLAADAAEHLSRAALDAESPLAPAPLEAQAARFVAAALGDPAERAHALTWLKARPEAEAARLAERFEALGPSGAPLAQLARDLAADAHARPSAGRLDALFDGGEAPAAAPRARLSPEEFVGLAERSFSAGRGGAAVFSRPADARPEAVPGDQELQDSVALSPLTNPERERVIVELFQRAGAKPEEIVLQDAGRGRHNILVVKKGRTNRVNVVGGHHDKVSAGHGTIDNWTGATMVVNLYQAMRDLDTEATWVFVAFAREEEGLLGSKKYVESLSPEELARIESMVNLDTLAVDGTFSWKNNSDRPLLDRVLAVARRENRALEEAFLDGGDSDSSTFRRAGVPGMTLFGASDAVIWDILHSARDTIAAFVLGHYVNAYHLTLALLKDLDQAPLRPAS
ncbi:MAG TPA: M28 family peptidase [Elusimicrobiota bacterium]|nr:M28 family peptidase [Elusimicrobiota bacterium]